jgi:hypothetical protein
MDCTGIVKGLIDCSTTFQHVFLLVVDCSILGYIKWLCFMVKVGGPCDIWTANAQHQGGIHQKGTPPSSCTAHCTVETCDPTRPHMGTQCITCNHIIWVCINVQMYNLFILCMYQLCMYVRHMLLLLLNCMVLSRQECNQIILRVVKGHENHTDYVHLNDKSLPVLDGKKCIIHLSYNLLSPVLLFYEAQRQNSPSRTDLD